jgi:hypothetical protein
MAASRSLILSGISGILPRELTVRNAALGHYFGFGPRFGFPSFAFFSSAIIWFRSDLETRRTFRNALSKISEFGSFRFGLVIFTAYTTPVGRG